MKIFLFKSSSFRTMLAGFLLVLLLLFVVYRLFLGYAKDDRKEAIGEASSGTVVTLLKGLSRGLVKRQGVLQGEVSEVRLVSDVVLSSARVELYEKTTVFSGGKAEAALSKTGLHTSLSPCFPQVLSVQPSAGLIVSRGFPLSPLGIVHIQQRITQFKPLPVSGKYRLTVFFARYPGGLMYAETDKGVELTIRVTLSDGSDVVWEGDTVVLSRAAPTGKRSGPAPVFESPVWEQQAQLSVHGNTGLRYAAASGDYNPHHLYWWSALPMGFSRPIAHGMWTLSAALHELEAMGGVKMSYPLRLSCDFKKPLLMPATITFGFRKVSEGVQFGVYNKTNSDPHLIGIVHQ
jgi:hypothetical protein